MLKADAQDFQPSSRWDRGNAGRQDFRLRARDQCAVTVTIAMTVSGWRSDGQQATDGPSRAAVARGGLHVGAPSRLELLDESQVTGFEHLQIGPEDIREFLELLVGAVRFQRFASCGSSEVLHVLDGFLL